MLKKVERTFYQEPRFPDYPYTEWTARISRALSDGSERRRLSSNMGAGK